MYSTRHQQSSHCTYDLTTQASGFTTTQHPKRRHHDHTSSSSKCSNHNNTQRKTTSKETNNTHLLHSITNGSTKLSAGCETIAQKTPAIYIPLQNSILGKGNCILVDQLYYGFNGCKLHHGVRNLASPKWTNTFVQTKTSGGPISVISSFRDPPSALTVSFTNGDKSCRPELASLSS